MKLCIIALSIFYLLSVVFADHSSFTIDYENHVFLKDGKPFRYISGEIHYNRIHPDQWNDRLSRLRAAGLNAVQIYVPWNFHEPFEGVFNFEGDADIVKFIKLAQANGFVVLLRPGPYICAEWENGGLPYWLLKKDKIELRKYSTPYVQAITNFYNKLFPLLTPLLYRNGGPIIMIQVENEYGSQFACDKKYTSFLRDLVRPLVGNETILYTVDSPQQLYFECGTIDGVFSTIDFGPTSADDIRKNFQLQQSYAKGGPVVNTEFYPGWFTTWGQLTNSNIPSINLTIESMKVMWESNASFSIYMFHGGSNFGFTNGAEIYAPLITSYDYSAPVAENGDITPLYKEIASWIGTLSDYDSKPQTTPVNFPSADYGEITLQPVSPSLIDALQPTVDQSKCVNDALPKSFEEIDQPYGFVLYSTVIPADGKLLNCSQAKDIVYVFLNKEFKGMLLSSINLWVNLTVNIGAKKGDQLDLLVENRGRQTYPAIVDRKGLFPDVLLDSTVLSNWTSCPVDLSASSSLFKSNIKSNAADSIPKDALGLPTVYKGVLQINDVRPRDTFFYPNGFLKGVVFINGFNLGRYWPASGPQVTFTIVSERSFVVDYENHVFLKDGKPFRYISGEIHYNRIHPDQWNDRLSRLRAAGLNAVQIYVPWNFHEPFEGVFNFEGNADIVKFIKLAQANELLVLLRPGPYVCAEWENGGLPYWLLKKDKIQMREYSTPYITAVDKYYKKLLPLLKPLLYVNGGPIIMVQVENEYGSYKSDKKYLKFLRALFIEQLGKEVLLYTTDGAGESYLKKGVVDGVFSTVDFGPTKNVAEYFQLQQKYSGGGPKVNSEFYPGWFTLWGQNKPDLPTTEDVLGTMTEMYNQNASFSFYMFHGGTNFGFWNGAEVNGAVITSYDYAAPVSESGDITPMYEKIQEWFRSLPDWPHKPVSTPKNNSAAHYGKVVLTKTDNLIDGVSNSLLSCKKSNQPLSFEDIDHPLGFVLYRTVLPFSGSNLTAENLTDHGYVYLDGVSQGVIIHNLLDYSKKWIELKNAKKGDQLFILVENRGRQTYLTKMDYKGLLPNVTLDGKVLLNWQQCGVNVESNSRLVKLNSRNRKPWILENGSPDTAGIYSGSFEIQGEIADTWFNPEGFRKGQVLINGFNIGRYWSSAGPQSDFFPIR
ncbi:hypothetical protein FO519_005881 [Halicephalobus sp. NKZ332]|nr:hypothetical protein FO519_005881 [Halicephalobus sp. NKZ332]